MLDRIALAALASVLLLAACGGSKNTPTTPTTTSTSTTSCSATVTQDPATKTLGPSAGTFTLTVTVGSGCSWTAVANDAFLSVTSGASGTGSGAVQVAVTANTGADRTGTLTIGGVTVTVTQTAAAAAPATCAFSVTPTSASVPASGSDLTFTVTVTQGANCAWTAATNDPALSVKSGASGTGNGTVVLTAGANNGGNRTATATIAGQAVTISQLAAGCAFTVSASSTSIPAGGGDVTLAISMTQGAGCTWTVASTDAFVTIKNAGSGSGSGNAVVTLAANTGAGRTASISVAGQTIVISQAGGNGGGGGGTVACVFTVTASTTSVPASGGDVQLIVTTPQGSACMWTVLLTDAFVTIKSGVPTTGNGTAVVTLAPNSGASRTTSITVAGQTIVISQAGGGSGSACAFTVTVSPSVLASGVPASGGDVQLTVTNTQGSSCAWTASVSSAFVTIVSGATGTGNGTAIARFAPNTGAARSVVIAVAGQNIIVSQFAALVCTPTVSPGNQTVSAASQSIIETVTLQDGCRWNATTADSFLTIPIATGTGNATVYVQVAANTGAARTGSITIAGQTFTIAQADGNGNGVVILTYRSQLGDYIGQGQTQTRTSPMAAMTTIAANAAHSEVHLNSPVSGTQWWSLDLSTASGVPLSPGYYDDTARWPFQPPTQPGLSYGMDGRGCNNSSGRFLVGEATFSGTTIQRFHAVFEQHCEYSSIALVGDIWIDAGGSTSVPPLSLPAPPGSPTSFLNAQSDSGDPVGGGKSVSYALSTVAMQPTFDPNNQHVGVTVSNGPSLFWRLDFSPPAGQVLAPGTYLNATRWPFQAAGVPGLSVTANGVGCNTDTGQFTVLEIQYDASNAIQRFHATFVQHCDGMVPALTGEIYVVANPWR